MFSKHLLQATSLRHHLPPLLVYFPKHQHYIDRHSTSARESRYGSPCGSVIAQLTSRIAYGDIQLPRLHFTSSLFVHQQATLLENRTQEAKIVRKATICSCCRALADVSTALPLPFPQRTTHQLTPLDMKIILDATNAKESSPEMPLAIDKSTKEEKAVRAV